MRLLSTLLLVLGSCMLSYAQISNSKIQASTNTAKHNGLEIGLLGGTMLYTGDTHCEQFLLKQVNGAGGAFVRYYLNDHFSTRLNLIAGKIKGDDRNYPNNSHGDRNFSFTNQLFDGNLTLEWEPWGGKRYKEGNVFRKIFSPYFIVGAGFVAGKPTVNYNETNNFGLTSQIALDKANSKGLFFNIPFGMGLRYDLTRRLTIGAEGLFRVPFTDYLDGVSQSADPNKRDWYYTGMINLGYKLAYHRDGDKDGVEDSQDLCPEVLGLAATKGCPDRDGDGVIDDKDACPNERGVVALNGCPDRDGDRIADKDDACPDVAGDIAYNGCPDRDGDGIIDSKDDCPDAKGSIAFNGCPDTDGDGISDKYDACPREKGSKADNGCPTKDADNDGVVDKDDLCPDKAGPKSNNGCPVESSVTSSSTTTVSNGGLEISPDAVVVGTFVDNASVVKSGSDIYEKTDKVIVSEGKEIPSNAVYTGEISGNSSVVSTTITSEDTAVFDEALYGIEFETGSAVIKSSSYSILNRVSDVMRRRGNFNFEISGHTDNVGNEGANQRLSEARAKSVFTYLVKKGITSSRLEARGYGSTNPVADNGSAAGRAKNRRVQFNAR